MTRNRLVQISGLAIIVLVAVAIWLHYLRGPQQSLAEAPVTSRKPAAAAATDQIQQSVVEFEVGTNWFDPNKQRVAAHIFVQPKEDDADVHYDIMFNNNETNILHMPRIKGQDFVEIKETVDSVKYRVSPSETVKKRVFRFIFSPITNSAT